MRTMCLVLVLAICGGACGPSLPRRSLLTDDLPAYATRHEVTASLLGNGWCMASSDAERDAYRRCPADADLWLEVAYRGDHLVWAMLIVPVTRTRRTIPVRGQERVHVEADPFRGTPEQVVIMDRNRTLDLGAASDSVSRKLFEALTREWQERFGPPVRHGRSWAEWRPSASLRAVVAITRSGVIELYDFDRAAVQNGALVARTTP